MEPTSAAAGTPAHHWGLRLQTPLHSEVKASHLLTLPNSWVQHLLPAGLPLLIWILFFLLQYMSGEEVNNFTSSFPAFTALGNVLLPQDMAGRSRNKGRGS